MPDEKRPQKDQLKVTDKRIFTADGQIREEFRNDIRPSDPVTEARSEKPAETPAERPAPAPPRQPERPAPRAQQPADSSPTGHERRRTMADKAANPNTEFANFIEPFIAQAYMSLGMLRNPYSPQNAIDPNAARQMIEMLTMLREKTLGNLTPEEEDFLETHLGELKLAYVQRTKSIG